MNDNHIIDPMLFHHFGDGIIIVPHIYNIDRMIMLCKIVHKRVSERCFQHQHAGVIFNTVVDESCFGLIGRQECNILISRQI